MLKDVLLSEKNFPRLVQDCKRLIDEQVAAKRGMSGMAIKAGYGAVKAFRPDVIERSLEGLLPDFVDKMEPFHQEYVAGGSKGPMRTFIQQNRTRIANALLGITDERARKTQYAALKSAYSKLRPFAQDNVEESLPAVGDLVEKYTREP